ncbi:Nif3-like dinuclear metal center hexameric protein [Okibacterium fritillariae]|uniref:Nif3-like dinuclear metal center hexameric protein n=1 Tax=Okibacterium fritillariae TaxID=123320 RepID=UPI004055474A
MTTTLRTVTDVVEKLWPIDGQESWDASGLIAGASEQPVSTVLLAVDAVAETVDEAVERGAGVLLTHHPLLLRGVTTIASSTYKGALLQKLIKNDCALLAAHTNADVVADGTSAVLARHLGLADVSPIVVSKEQPLRDADPEAPLAGIGRVGTLPQPVRLGDLARALGTILPATATGVRVAGEFDRLVQRVALCGGAGDSLTGEAAVQASDVYITSDLRHHPASEFVEQARLGDGPALIDTSHWASEWLWLDVAAEHLRRELPGVEVLVSEIRTDPWDFVVTQ